MRVFILFVGCLAGCNAEPVMVTTYYKAATTEQQYQQDVYACQRDAAPLRDVIRERSMINQCMASKGYTARLERVR